MQEILMKLEALDLDVSSYECDHIAYRTTTKKEFEAMVEEFSKLGKKLPDAIIRSRIVSVFKLYKPLVIGSYTIPAIELLEPAEGDKFRSGLEHAEFIVNADLEEFSKQNESLNWNKQDLDREISPELGLAIDENLGVKFHNIPILEARKIQVSSGKL